jgi:hypothetical protein
MTTVGAGSPGVELCCGIAPEPGSGASGGTVGAGFVSYLGAGVPVGGGENGAGSEG